MPRSCDTADLSRHARRDAGGTSVGALAAGLVIATAAAIAIAVFGSWPSKSVEPEALNAAIQASPVLIEHDLGTGSREFSGVAINEYLNRLLIVDDEGLVFEFDLDPFGLPIVPARRTMRIAIGAGDTEGIAWIRDQTYVIAHENDGHLTVVNITEQTTTIDATHLVRTIDTSIREIDGNGIEGVAYVADLSSDIEFIAVRERPPMLVLINHAGEVEQTIDIELGPTDISDVSTGLDGSITLVSDEGQAVFDVQLLDDQVTATSSLRLTFETSEFEQPEGIVRSSDGSSMYVVGEKPGQGLAVFGLWRIGT